jgi:hypothetical protein
MDDEAIEFLSAVLLVSANPGRLAAFYRDVVGVPLTRSGREVPPHWGATSATPLRDPSRRDLPRPAERRVGAVKLAFTVFDIRGPRPPYSRRAAWRSCIPEGHRLLLDHRDQDPDGNLVEFTQLP